MSGRTDSVFACWQLQPSNFQGYVARAKRRGRTAGLVRLHDDRLAGALRCGQDEGIIMDMRRYTRYTALAAMISGVEAVLLSRPGTLAEKQRKLKFRAPAGIGGLSPSLSLPSGLYYLSGRLHSAVCSL